MTGTLDDLELILDALPVLLWRLDLDPPVPVSGLRIAAVPEIRAASRLAWANAPAARLLGLPAGDLSQVDPSADAVRALTADAGAWTRFAAGHWRLSGYEATVRDPAGAERHLRCTWAGVVRDQCLQAVWIAAENVTAERQLRDRLAAAVESAEEPVIGQSPAIRRVLEKVDQVASADSTVLILGETGTGKELVARAIHARSPRAGRPLVAVNCGAIAASLVESELFGHEKGAFTGAVSRKIGRFELADGGTLFLDEIGDLSLELQVKLLRVLQEGEFTRVGGTQPVRVNVRVIAATHRDLSRLVREGAFRQDLFYRLNVFPIRTPPLRERMEDLPLLVRHFVERYAARLGKRIETVPDSLLDALARHPWPGNIRELANLIERSVIVSDGPSLQLAEWVTGQYQPAMPAPAGSGRSLEDLERDHIRATLERLHWKVSGPGGAAEALSLKPTTLEARMKRLGIVRPAARTAG